MALMLMGAAGAFLAAFLRDLRLFLPALRLVFFLAFFLATFFLAFFLAFFFAVFFLAVFFLAAFFLVPTFRFFATRFLATRFFVVFFFAAALLVVRLFADVLREDLFFARALDFLRVALANGHLLKAYAFAGKRRSRGALYETKIRLQVDRCQRQTHRPLRKRENPFRRRR
ncbi:MAG: hypothetical protein O7B81_10710 [Gammaproteobacteria bacterium]|nr:hypothetical protein [Gammaproteobacteria bacterium]